jgi:hypothetical protein
MIPKIRAKPSPYTMVDSGTSSFLAVWPGKLFPRLLLVLPKAEPFWKLMS